MNKTEYMKSLMERQAFFKGFTGEQLEKLAACSQERFFPKGSQVAQEGDTAEEFYLIRQGEILVELRCADGDLIPIESLGVGEVFGWSWMFPPYTWTFDGRALSDCKVIGLNGECVLKLGERHPAFGFALMKRMARIMTLRLQATRVRLSELNVKKTRLPTG